ncbi:MAG: hypothetical protein COB98_03725, partial [Flavobacteriaceae bacterium]
MKNIVTNPNYFRYSKTILFLMLAICLNTTNLLAQTAVDFTARYSDKLRGDLTLISNNILNRDAGVGQRPNDPYNDFKNKWGYYTYNDNFNMAYIDVDTDTSTFSSSKATLNIPNSTCLNVKFAGLYWGAIYKEASRASGYNTVKFKLPGAANYLDIEADDIIFDEEGRYTPDPYACFADVTGYLQALSSPVGEYTVANIHASLGKSGAGAPSGGTSGGWTLVVVYEDPLLTNKNITIFDGFSGVNMQGNSADISVAGFTTIPVGPVKASIGVSCIEGDANLGGDAYSIKSGSNVSFKVLSDPVNPSTNFFNSSITINGSHFTDKVPNSINNLGWDSDLFLVNNPSNSVIGNDENSATLRLQTNRDSYFVFQTSFAIEIIEPKIVVIKTVDDGTSDITGDSVILGESLWYQLRFQNTGNDSATNTIIKDLLPINVDLDEASIKLPSFVTYGYTLPTATTGGIITFDIDDSIVTKGATFYDIRFKVTVTDQCNDLRDACENKIENVAFAYYTGLVSGTEISDDPSFYGLDNCNFGLSGSTNFLVDVDGCTFERREVMCGASLDITAGDGFASYVWRNALGVEVGTSKTLTVTKLGVYTVEKTANLPCVDASETITVVPFGTQTNPLIVKDISGKYLYVDAVKTCPNDGRQLSEIYLCGTADYRDITVSNLGAQEIKWQRLISNQGAADQDCPNVDVKSNWEDLLGFTDSYKADTEGEYRLKIIYTGGCFTNYYFNVFKATVKPVIVEKNIICGNDGSITINNMDTSLYEFSVVLDGKPAGTFSSLVSYPITVAGNYTVYFRQIGANPLACIPTIQGINIATRTIDLENDITITVNDIFCAGNTGGIRVQVNNVPGDYTMVLHNLAGDEIGSYGPEPLNDYLFDALAGGNYRVTITTPDCLFITEIIQVKEEISLQLIAGISQNITCREGNIQVDPSGGKPPYNYAVHSYKLENDTGWTTIAPIDYVYQTSRIFDIPTINGAGEYKYIVEDRIFCTAISNIVKIVLEPDVDFDLETVDISCYGKESGSISFVLNDNSKKLAFALDDGIAGNGKYDAIISGSNPEAFEPDSFNNSGVFSNLPAGNYTFILRVGKSNKACFFTFPITITQPTDTLLGTLVESQDLTCNKLGEVTVSASGGTPPYQYSIDGITFVSSNVFKGLSSGSNIVTIRDANDCEVPTNTVVFIALDMPTDLSISQTQITCPSLTSDLTVDSVLGGTLPITYEIIAPAGAVINNGNNKIFTQLVADTYRIKVTDAKGCSYEEDYTIAAITEIAITGVVDNQLICKGGTSGNATYTVSGFTETYSYTLNDGTEIKGQNNNSILLTGVSAGTYTINITDEKTLCTDTVTVTLLEPAEDLSMSLTATPITCTSNATITATANGGWGALEYQLENAAGIALIPYGSSNLFTKVLPGDYTVFVKDINGCIEPDTITIDPVVIPTVSLIANTVCYTAAGTITITATGTGSGPLQYALNGGAYQVGTVFTNILPGDHSVTVKDMYGCTATSTVMSISTELSLSTQFVSISACGTGTDVTITANGGDGTYTYSVVATGGVPTYGASNVISINTAGVYDVTIKDGKDCIASETITIVKDSALTILAPSTKILCNGELSSITADASGGQAPYQYQLEDTSGGILTSYQASPVFNNVSAGDYKIRLKDARACTETVNITITEPVILAAIVNTLDLVSCNNNIDAAVEITWLSGGVAPYVYSFDTVNYSDSNTGRLTAGNHTVFLRDANLCIFSMSVTIAAPLKAPTFTTSTVVYNCDGTANVSISPVDPLPLFDYTYNLNATGAVGPNNGLGFDFTDLGVGTHSIEIGYTPISPLVACPRTEIITVVVAPNMEFNAVITASTDISCKAGNNGDITVQVSNFDTTQGYQYSLDGGANWKATLFINTFTVPLLKVGSYTIAVRDVRSEGVNCTINLSQTLNEPTLLVASAKITEVLTCNNVGGEITASAVGGIVAYEYQLENTTGTVHTPYGPDNLFTNVLVGDYIVFVRDANECESQVTITMNPAITPTLIIEADTDCYTATGNVTITATGTGTAPLKYALNGGAYQESNEFSNVLPGIHEVTVKDVYGCEVTATTLTVFNELTLSTQFLSISACTDATDATITANGGDGTYMYSIMPTGVNPTAGDYGTDNVITINAIGNYDVYVKDGEKCETFETITIVKDLPLTISASSTPILCNGDLTTITGAGSGGEGPYSYRLENALDDEIRPYQSSPSFKNVSVGNYKVRVKDARNCDSSFVVNISEPAYLIASAGVTELVSCNNGLNAEVRITNAEGGTPFAEPNPYRYSFDGGMTYITSNISKLPSGTHTVYVKDAEGCTFPMEVVVAAKITAPDYIPSLTYDCDGNGIYTITAVDPMPLYSYTFNLDGVVDVPADITVPTYGGPTGISFPDIVPGTHTVNMNFTPIESPTKSVLLEESFGSGANTPITNIDPVYCYEPQDGTGGCFGGKHINDGEYSVTQKVAYPFGSWRNPNDHSDMVNGRFLAINVGGAAGNKGVIYKKEVKDIIPNRDISISLYAYNLLRQGTSGGDPSIKVELVDPSGTILATSPVSPVIPKNNNADDWHEFKITLNPGANTNLSIVIRTNSAVISGNDIAIDDIFAYQEPEQCPSTTSVTFTVATDKEFKVATNSVTDATCNGGSDGSIQMQVSNFDPLFGYQFSTDGGTTWSVTQFTNVLTVNGLDAGAHDIEIGYITDALGTQDCIETITEIIGEPTAVVASASITGNLTCTNAGATITASAVGGGGSYEYQLEDIAGLPIVAFKTSPVFINLAAGSYIVRVKDVFECEDIIDAQIDVVLPTPIIYTTSQTNCYAGDSNGSISVNVTAGNGNYQFSINGSAFQTPSPASGISHTFSNLTAGTYTIDVRDQFNCTVTSAVTIDSQLTGSALLVNDIDCNAPTNGEILINANGGAGGNTYQWSNDGGGIWNGTNFSGNIFTIGIDGNYIFKITDASGCFVITNTIRLTPAINPVFTLLATDVKCNGDLSGVIDITIDTTKGLAPYVINIINTISTTDYGTQTSGLPAGNYEVTVTDAKGCFTANLVTIAEPTAINGNITKIDISCANPFDVKGTISIDAGGSGTGPFTYRVYNNDYSFNETVDTDTLGGTNYTFSNLNFGGYKVVIIDTNGCESISDITIGTSPDILVTIVGVATCTAGSITVQANTTSGSLSTGPYYFAIYPIVTSAPGGAGWFAGTPGVLASGAATEEYTFNGLTPGVTYTFVVYDASTKCTYIQESDKLLNPISTLTSTIETITDITCTGASDGIVDFTISNYEASATQVDYQVYQTITINPILGQSGSFVGLTGVAASDSLTGLAPGEYYIQFTEVNGGNPGCITTSPPFLIQQSPVLLDIKASLTKNENCNKLGVITALAQYGTSPYEYQIQVDTDSAPTVGTWGGGNTTGIFNVAVGDYKVFVKDAFNCIQSVDVSMLLDPSPAITVTADYSACPSEGDFTVSINLDTAGIPPYSIQINGGAAQVVTDPFNTGTPLIITGLNSGINTFQITDSNGCSEAVADAITIVAPLEFNATITKLFDCTVTPEAAITISDVVGSGNYTYEIDGVEAGANNVTAGTGLNLPTEVWANANIKSEYIITITDTATNCTAVKSVFIVAALNPIIPTLPNTVDALCSGSNDGSISITAQDNGIGPFTFAITAPVAIPFTTNNGYTATFDNLQGSVAGTNYTITVTGANGCTTDKIVTIFETIPVSIDLVNTTPFGCTIGDIPNAANITVTTVTGGNGTYTRYEFVNSDGLPVQDGTSKVLTITFDSLTDTYSVDMGAATPGLFTINVYDSNGCLATDTETIILFDEINNVSITVLEDISCVNLGEDIQIDVISIGGDPNKFEFSDDNGATWKSSNIFNDLAVGTHNFIIRHTDTGCTYPISHTIGEPNTFTPKVTIVNQVYCKGSTTGNVTFELEDATYLNGFDWEIFDTNDTTVDFGTEVGKGPTPNILIAAGSYYAIITQNNLPSCDNRVYFTITEPALGISGIYTSSAITCLGKDGSISITPNGGWGNYEYYAGIGTPGTGDWDASNSFTGLGIGTYEVWIKDMSGCPFRILPDVELEKPTPITATLTINKPNCSGADGEIEVTGVTGGEGTNYQYQLFLNNIAIGSPQTNPIFSGLGRGTYR